MAETVENGFYVAVVGDGDEGEPIRVQDGHWYSIGCADPHDLASVLIIRELNVAVPTKAERNEEAREEAEEAVWEERARQVSYDEYRVLFYRRHGRYPGHRRWPAALSASTASPARSCGRGPGIPKDKGDLV